MVVEEVAGFGLSFFFVVVEIITTTAVAVEEVMMKFLFYYLYFAFVETTIMVLTSVRLKSNTYITRGGNFPPLFCIINNINCISFKRGVYHYG